MAGHVPCRISLTTHIKNTVQATVRAERNINVCVCVAVHGYKASMSLIVTYNEGMKCFQIFKI